MRLTNLKTIKSILDISVLDKGHFIYIAPLHADQYNQYIELLTRNKKDNDIIDCILNDDDEVLNKTIQKIQPDSLIETNLYVSSIENFQERIELIDFIKENGINHEQLLSNKELIDVFEVKPENFG